MKKTTRAATLLLAMLLFLGSCGGNANETKDEPAKESLTESQEPVETEPARPMPAFAPKTWDGEEFRVCYRFTTKGYACRDIVTEEGTTGDPINDAVYARNVKLEEDLKIKLNAFDKESPTSVLQADARSGDSSCDVLLDCMNSLYPQALSNYLYDYKNLPYYDVSMPWWDENCEKELSLAHHVFVQSSDVSMKTSGCVRFINWNKDMWFDNNLPDPYELVANNEWTIDAMETAVMSVSEDLNGDGKMDSNDRWGYLQEGPDYLLNGMGVLYTDKDENDLPYIDCINERTVTALEKLKKMLDDKTHVIDYSGMAKGQDTSAYPHIFDYGRSRFVAGQTLLISNCADDIQQFAAMEQRYGLLPNPKLDSEQAEYYHLIDAYAPVWAFPANQRNVELASAAMEYWGYLSDELVDAFYERIMKKKRADAPEDAAILDLVRNTVRYEIATVMDLSIAGVISNAYSSGNLMSSYKKSETVIQRKINRIVTKLEGSAETAQ